MPAPPRAEKRPHTHHEHGVERDDPYYWLRDRDDPAVRAYLEAENAYLKEVMAGTETLQQRLFEEIKGRVKQDDDSYPVRWKRYLYYDRYEDGSQYPLHCRRRADVEGAGEEVTLDVPAMAAGHGYYDLDAGDVSPDERLLAYSVDTEGRRFYTLRIKDLETGETLPDTIPDVDGGHAWAADSRTLFYTKQDPDTLRSHQVWRHALGTPNDRDALVYEEGDDAYECSVGASKSGRYIEIACSHTLSDEVLLIPAGAPETPPSVFAARRRGLEYEVEPYRDGFYILTNKGAENFRLMWAAEGATGEEHWREVVPHRPDVLLCDFEVFDGYLVTAERERGLDRLRVRPLDDLAAVTTVDFGEPTYSAWLDANLEFDSEWLRYGFSSPKTPTSLFEFHLPSGGRRLLKQQPVLGGFDPADYTTERHLVATADGVEVPLSIVYRTGRFERDGDHPALLYAYGAYGSSTHPTFSASRVSLLDRGFAFAIAHVRGGQELGRAWYEGGRLLRKTNTFHDFIACAEHLVAQRYTRPQKLCGAGGSAGGLLIGAVANLRPDLFAALVADVPFVDVVTTMLDETVPLTTGEYDEWGDPAERVHFDHMLSYSPYDNVAAKDYPAMLVTCGLHDSQVQYWEPAKWVARLRELKTDGRPLLLKTDLDAGHGGASGRHDRYREIALEQAFLLGVVDPETP